MLGSGLSSSLGRGQSQYAFSSRQSGKSIIELIQSESTVDLDEYQSAAVRRSQLPSSGLGSILTVLGLAGEVGELSAEFKKQHRDGPAHKLFPAKIREE